MKAMETIQGIDEEVPLKAFKKPPVIVSKEGWISGDDVNFVWRLGFMGIRYKYKKAADRTFKNVRFILRTLYSIKFNVED